MRRFSDETPEYRREMRLRLEPDAERDVDKALLRVLEECLRAGYALPHQIFMRTHPDGSTKLGCKMHPRKSSSLRQIGEPDRLLDMCTDILDYAREPPLWKRGDTSALRAAPLYRSTASDPRKDSHADGVRVQADEKIGRASCRERV